MPTKPIDACPGPISNQDPEILLTEGQAASLLCLSMRTLQAWRQRGGGPLYVRAGRAIRYRRRDLVSWVNANTTSSTSADAIGGVA